MSTNKPTRAALANRWISIEYEDKSHKARWYKGLVKKYDTQSDRYLVRVHTRTGSGGGGGRGAQSGRRLTPGPCVTD